MGRPIEILIGSQSLSETTYKSNTSSLVSRFDYGNGVYKTYAYDDQDRLSSESINGILSRSYIYDKRGNLVETTDLLGNLTTRFHYDLIGRINGITASDGQSMNFVYDGYNRLSLSKWAFGNTALSSSYIYGDAATANQKPGLIYGVKLNGTQQIGYEYDELARLQQRILDTTTPFATEYTYHNGTSANTTTTLVKTVKNGNNTLEYAYDEVGNIISVKKNGTTIEEYTYDTLNQLVSATYGGNTYTYTYKTGGNITEVKKNGVVAKEYTYSNTKWRDLLTEFNGQTITYDTIGNPLNYRSGMNFTWQNGRQLASISESGYVIASYTYNADGLRTSKTDGEIETEYYWLNGTLYAQKTGDEFLYFLYDENVTVYGLMVKNSSEQSYYYYEFNLQGDIIGIVDGTGTRVVEYTYGAWGDILSVTGSMEDTIGQLNPLRYRGYYYDGETGFYATGTRYYDPEIGRFINADSVISGTGESVQGYNLFTYCFNNPINMSDPTGNWPKWIKNIGNVIKNVVDGVITGAKKIKNAISEICGVSLNIDKEQPLTYQYSLWTTTESGTGYNKNFDTGKPINFYRTVPENPWLFWKIGEGIDVNINGYGAGLQMGQDKNIAVHLKNSSVELGQNILGRNYIKHSYIDNNGIYIYNKFSINTPEIGATVLLAVYAPSIVLSGAAGATVISIFY